MAFILALVAASSWAAAFDPSDYTVTNLGGVATGQSGSLEGTDFWAYSLTDAGQVTGYGMAGASNEWLCSWNATKGFYQDYNCPGSNSPYVSNYVPVAGNDAGSIVWTDASGAGHIWSSSTGDTQPAALANAGAFWINSAGLVVGGTNGAQGVGAGILYNPATQTSTTLPGPAYYINDAGQVGGTINFAEAHVWSQTASNGWVQGTTDLPSMCWAPGISQNGRYVAGQDPTYTSGMVYDNVANTYATITGGTGISVNDNGWVGGSSATLGNYGYTESLPSAWLWDGTTLHTTDLSALLPTGYTAVSVMAVNDSDDILMWGATGDEWYDIHSFLLTPTATPPTQHPGDANGDGRVDVNDLTIVLTNFGQSGMAWSQGNMDSDPTGTVDVNDLTIVLSNYGWTASASVAAVPEPGVLALAAGGLVGLLAFAWRSRK